ncbi:MAG: cobalt ABC transporter permease, partial [Lacticaseibacillus rhamnosus]
TYEYFKLGYGAYSFGMILGLVTVRLLSVIFFGVVLVQLVMKLYEQAAGVKRLAGR